MPLPQSSELAVSTLGPCHVPSPLRERGQQCVDETSRVLVSGDARDLQPFLQTGESFPTFEPAGPRPALFFDPATLTCGIVTCGGICPGLNNVIRSVVLTLTHSYGVRRIRASATATLDWRKKVVTNRCRSRWKSLIPFISRGERSSARLAARRNSAI